jgi:dTDP-glucose 4,6-dehydratase
VQIGSSEVYGSVTAPASEDAPYNPSSPYAASKAVFDFHLKAIAKHQHFPALIVMPSNGYCEGQTLNRIIPKAIICARNGTKLKLQGGGVARKSYLHADDISRAIMLCESRGMIGSVYNVGPEFAISIKTVVEMVANMMGKRLDDVAEIAPERTGQDSQYLLDSARIKTLGWAQKVYLKEGIERMINWVENHPELLTMDSTYWHKP